MKKSSNTVPILYRGIDYLRIGIYTNTADEYEIWIDELKRIYRESEYEEQKIKLNNQEYRIKTRAKIYPYIIMLIHEPTGISFRFGKGLSESRQKELQAGKATTPNIMIEVQGKPLRPLKLEYTREILYEVFENLYTLRVQPLAYTFSRIDYAIDFPRREDAMRILRQAKKRKLRAKVENDTIQIRGNTKRMWETARLKFIEEAEYITLGDPRRETVVFYIKTDADKELISIYEAQGYIYTKDIAPHRIELRLNTYSFTNERKIYLFSENRQEAIMQATDIQGYIEEATKEVKKRSDLLRHYIEAPHPIFGENQILHETQKERLRKIYKKVQKRELKEEAKRLLTQLIRVKANHDLTADSFLEYCKDMSKKNSKMIEKLREAGISHRELFPM